MKNKKIIDFVFFELSNDSLYFKNGKHFIQFNDLINIYKLDDITTNIEKFINLPNKKVADDWNNIYFEEGYII